MTQEQEILARFDERFSAIEFCHTGEGKMPYVEATRDSIKAFILAELRARDTQVKEAIEGMKVEIPTPTSKNDISDVWTIGRNDALTDLLARLFPETK